MGCDIHAYIEHNGYNQQYRTFAKVSIDRDYALFHCLSGVRGYNTEVEPISLPKGIPENIGYMTKDEYCLHIGEGSLSQEDADKYIKSGSSKRFDEHHISHPDWHSASWLNLLEVKEAYKRYLNYYRENIEQPEKIKTPDEFHKFIEDTRNITKPISRNKDIEAVIACLENLSLHYEDVRLVFWFDN